MCKQVIIQKSIAIWFCSCLFPFLFWEKLSQERPNFLESYYPQQRSTAIKQVGNLNIIDKFILICFRLIYVSKNMQQNYFSSLKKLKNRDFSVKSQENYLQKPLSKNISLVGNQRALWVSPEQLHICSYSIRWKSLNVINFSKINLSISQSTLYHRLNALFGCMVCVLLRPRDNHWQRLCS